MVDLKLLRFADQLATEEDANNTQELALSGKIPQSVLITYEGVPLITIFTQEDDVGNELTVIPTYEDMECESHDVDLAFCKKAIANGQSLKEAKEAFFNDGLEKGNITFWLQQTKSKVQSPDSWINEIATKHDCGFDTVEKKLNNETFLHKVTGQLSGGIIGKKKLIHELRDSVEDRYDYHLTCVKVN